MPKLTVIKGGKAKSGKAKTSTRKANRNKLIQRIHVAKRQVLQDDDDVYRDLLKRVTGKTSCKDMTIKELKAAMIEFGRKEGGKKYAGAKPNVTARRQALINKIEAMLLDMNLSWAYVKGMAKRMFKVEAIEWLDDNQLYKLTQALAVFQSNQAEKNKE